MAQSITLWDRTTPLNNGNADSGINWLENQAPSTVNNSARAMMERLAEFYYDDGAVNTVAGTGDAITVTVNDGLTAYITGHHFRFVASAANTTAVTLNVNAIGAKAIRKISGGTDVALSAGDIAAGETYTVVYRASANAAAGAWVLIGLSAGVTFATIAEDLAGTSTTKAVNPAGLAAERLLTVVGANYGFTASVGASALTLTMVGADGNPISASNPATVPFRNVTLATGTPSNQTVTSVAALVISSGSTLGMTSGVAGRVWVVGFNDGGTFRLGVINCRSGADATGYTLYPLTSYGIASSTAEGGAGAADSAQVFYTGTAVTSKAYTVLGFADLTEATAGTWATAPASVQVFGPGINLPGDTVQLRISQDGAAATTTTVLPVDNTIPQSGEGAEFMTRDITPVASANLLRIRHTGIYSNSGTSGCACALFRDAATDAISTGLGGLYAANQAQNLSIDKTILAGSTSSTTMRIRAGGSAGTFRFNSFNGAQVFGGVAGSVISVEEIMA